MSTKEKVETKRNIEVEQVEDASVPAPLDSDVAIDEKRWYSRFLKQPAPLEFNADLLAMNETELDPAEVKRLTRKLDMLICPALAVCYAFYYM